MGRKPKQDAREILGSAMELFRTRGYDHTSCRDIEVDDENNPGCLLTTAAVSL